MIPVALLLLIAARWPDAVAVPNVDEFHSQMLRRFSEGQGLGMSRIARWSSLSQHFRAPQGARTDFAPENDRERAIIAQWSSDGWQTGLYVFGSVIKTEPQSSHFHRALKGPAVLNENTPRAGLPAWDDVYPIAAEAMKRFESGESSHTASVNGWSLVARPVTAAKESCVRCHKPGSARPGTGFPIGSVPNGYTPPPVKTGESIGGVIYLFRR